MPVLNAFRGLASFISDVLSSSFGTAILVFTATTVATLKVIKGLGALSIAMKALGFEALVLSRGGIFGLVGALTTLFTIIFVGNSPSLIEAVYMLAAAFGALSIATNLGLFRSLGGLLTGLVGKFTVLGSAASKAGMFMKGALGVAGVGMVADTVGGGPTVGGAFQGAAGGAMTGFALGGPVGALIGGAVGIGASLFNEGGMTQSGVPFSIVGEGKDGKGGELRVDPPGARYFSAEKTKDLFGGSNGAIAETLNRISSTMDKIDKRDAKTQKTTGGRKVVATATINNQIDRRNFQKIVVDAIDDHGDIRIVPRT